MIKCIAIDDEPPALDLVKSYIEMVPFLELHEAFYSSTKAIKTIQEEKIDLVFMDINMPDLSGMELSRLLPDHTKVIFTTAHEEYALEGYKVNAIDYLVKPFPFEDFLRASTKAKEYIENQNDSGQIEEDYFFVKADYRLHKVVANEILFLENMKEYVRIHFKNGSSLMTLMSLKSLEARLSSKTFMKVHRSYIVNLREITVVERNRIVFGKHFIPVADAYKAAFKAFLEK